jgi:hypothetical protein
VWLHVVVQGVANIRGQNCVRQVELSDLRRGVNAGVSAAGNCAGDGRAVVQPGGCGFEQFLDGQTAGLALPAHERGTIILEEEGPARRGSGG